MQDKSAREALQTFVGGKGDVLLAYENEAITAQQKGEDVDYVDPRRDDPDPEPDRGRRSRRHPSRRRRSSTSCARDEAQKIFAEKGYRPVVHERGRQVEVSRRRRACSRSTNLGGWPKVNDEFFDPENGIVAEHRDEDRGSRLSKLAPQPRRARAPRPRLGARRPRAVGVARLAYLSLIVLIPLAAVVVESLDGRRSARSGTRSPSPQAVAALKLTLVASLDRRARSTRSPAR